MIMNTPSLTVFTSNKLSLLARLTAFSSTSYFPENPTLETTLTQHKTCYANGTFKLSELVENASAFVHALEPQRFEFSSGISIRPCSQKHGQQFFDVKQR